VAGDPKVQFNRSPRISIRAYGKGTYDRCYFGKDSFGAGIWGGYNVMKGCVIESGGNAEVYICPGNSPHDHDHGWSIGSYTDPDGPFDDAHLKPENQRKHTTNRNQGMIVEGTTGKISIGETVSQDGVQYPANNGSYDKNCTGPLITSPPGYTWDDGHNDGYQETNSTNPAAVNTHTSATKTLAGNVGPRSTWVYTP
jgi:hypothetical protein